MIDLDDKIIKELVKVYKTQREVFGKDGLIKTLVKKITEQQVKEIVPHDTLKTRINGAIQAKKKGAEREQSVSSIEMMREQSVSNTLAKQGAEGIF